MAIRTGPTLAEIEAARERIGGLARVTPVFSSETLARRSGRPVMLKAENLQRTGSFKIRGAVNKIATLTDEERAAGVVTASAGNHGQAVALAAREAGVAATVFMPQDAPMAKVDATRSYGAEVVLVGEGFDEADVAAQERVDAGATLVHAFEDEVVIAGAGAASVAAVLGGKLRGDGPACALLSGGNIDATLLIEIARHGLTQAGRFLVIRAKIDDRPGALARLLGLIADERVNVLTVEHHREGIDLPVIGTEVELTLATRDEEHCDELLERLAEWGYATERVS